MFGQAGDQRSARRGRARLLGATLAVVMAASLALLDALADNAVHLRRGERVKVAVAGDPAPLTLPEDAEPRSDGDRVIDRLLNRTPAAGNVGAPSQVAFVIEPAAGGASRPAERPRRQGADERRKRDNPDEQPALALPRGERGSDAPDPMTDSAQNEPKDSGKDGGGKPRPAKRPGGRPAPNGEESYPDSDDRAHDEGDDGPKKSDKKAAHPQAGPRPSDKRHRPHGPKGSAHGPRRDKGKPKGKA